MLLAFLTLLSLAARPDVDPDAPIPTEARVVKVYDGDTLTLDNGDKVRLRWVNTPERTKKEPFWEEARRVAERVALNKRVQLIVAPDVKRDGYGRILAGITDGRTNLSVELLEQGLGHVFIIPPEDTDIAPLLAAQEVARSRLRGIWSTEDYKGTLHITSFHANPFGSDELDVNGEYMRVCNVTSNPVDLQGYVLTAKNKGERFELPQMVVPAGHTVLIKSGRGYHQRDPSMQLEIYLGLSEPLWDNYDDQASIFDPSGQLVDAFTHKTKSKPEESSWRDRRGSSGRRDYDRGGAP